MEVLIDRALTPRSIMVEVTNGITRVFLVTPLGGTTPFVGIVKGGTLVNAIGKLELVLLVENLGIGLWIAHFSPTWRGRISFSRES